MSEKVRPNLLLYNKLSGMPMGKLLFSKGVCIKAPYFGSIKPFISELGPGQAKVQVRKRRAVLNHLGTVHAIAMCNMAELAGGLMTDVSVPTSHRWIPKGMKVEYLKKAETDLIAYASASLPREWPHADDFITKVEIKDSQEQVVAQMEITMWVSAKMKTTG